MKKANPFTLGLRFKLAVSILLTVIISMAILSLTLLTMIRAELFGRMISQAGQVSSSIERLINIRGKMNLKEGAAHTGRLSLNEVLLPFYDEDLLVGIALYTPDGRELARQGGAFDLPPDGWQKSSDRLDYRLPEEGRSEILIRSALDGTVPPLRLAMVYSLGKLNKVIAFSQLKTIFQLSASAFLIFMFLLFILTIMVINPLKVLSMGIERISQGNLDYRVYLSSGDELGFLAESLNNMVSWLKENEETIHSQLDALKKAHQSTLDAQKKLIAAEKMASLGTLSAGVAHEVGNPLSAVIGYINLLRKGGLSAEDSKDFLDRASNELDRIHHIMLEMLDYARSSSEPASPVELNGIIRYLVANLEKEGVLGHLSVSTDLGADLPKLQGFPHKLEQVFTNLINNAVWATDPEGSLHIKTEIVPDEEDPHRRQVKITFTDDGCGIPEKDINKIFDPFFTTRLGQGGTGLGLAISRRIIEEMGGTISVSCSPDQKTSFIMCLPV